MPYYLCPKCGSKDSYSATEIVSEHKHKSGHMFAGPENALGMTPVMRVGGSSRTEHKELTVLKCRMCDCLLGEKDAVYTKKEKLQMQLQIAQEGKAKRMRKKRVIGFIVSLLTVWFSFATIFSFIFVLSLDAGRVDGVVASPTSVIVLAFVISIPTSIYLGFAVFRFWTRGGKS
jgi:hypothetical protein